jgi:ribosomal protein S12 methylthiotransferase accessory factor
VALSRAVTEAAQSRLTWVSGARDDVQLDPPDDERPAFDTFAEPAGGEPVAGLPDRSTATVDGDLALLLALFAGLGVEPFAVDLTRPELGLPVVRVVAPGLREQRDHG